MRSFDCKANIVSLPLMGEIAASSSG